MDCPCLLLQFKSQFTQLSLLIEMSMSDYQNLRYERPLGTRFSEHCPTGHALANGEVVDIGGAGGRLRLIAEAPLVIGAWHTPDQVLSSLLDEV